MLYVIMVKSIRSRSNVSNRKGVCAYCGEIHYLTVDHKYPQYLWKWSRPYMDEDDWLRLRAFINNTDNKVPACETCNVVKGNLVIFKEPPQIISKGQKAILEAHKAFLEQGGNNRCIICNQLLTPESMVLRRKGKGWRVVENAVALCNDPVCHRRFSHERDYKQYYEDVVDRIIRRARTSNVSS